MIYAMPIVWKVLKKNGIIAIKTNQQATSIYPQANIVAVDYDPGASKINQENRIKLMLSSAE